MAEFSHATTRRARKQHRCDHCSRAIEPGETYEHQSNIWDGRWCTWRGCQHCTAALRGLWNTRFWDTDEWDEADLFDALIDSGRVDLLRIAVGIRCKWRFLSGRTWPVPAIPPRTCIDCSEPADVPYSYTWCAPCDARRIERVGRQLAALPSQFGGAG